MQHVTAEEILISLAADLAPVAAVIETLQRNGYSHNFILFNNHWKCLQNEHCYTVDEIVVDEIYRFTDVTGVLSGIFIYALHENWHDIKGLLVVDLNNTENFKR